MDVILIQPRDRFSRSPAQRVWLPLGLLAVATTLDVAGYKVRIIDQRIDSDWEGSVLAELKTKPICVGVTAITGAQIWWALKASEIVKRHSDVPVVWGGVHPSLLPQQTLENPYVDIVVQGEGEETFFELVEALGNRGPLHQIKGVWYKEGGDIKQNPPRPFIDLNQQPQLSYHLVNLKKHMLSFSGRDCLFLETSRGCPFNCAFCYSTCFHRRQWRALTPEQTLLRIKRVVDEYGVEGIAFSDDNFFTSPDRAYQILEGIVQQWPDIVWGKGDIRLDLLAQLDGDFLHLIERSGCLSLLIGVESGSQRIANLLRKEIDVSQAISVNRRLARYQMQPAYLFMIGIPGETETDLAETASLMLRLVDENQKATQAVAIFVPYPGTELFDLSVQHGLPVPQKLEEWIPFSRVNRRPDYPWLSPKRKRLVQMLSFCGGRLAKDRGLRLFASDAHPLYSLVFKLYYPIARKRVTGLHYRFLPELKVAEILGFRGY
ncbi:MAG: B12-binding domain-containing radical SAM protein [Dehalococcoidia bacterium]